LSQSLFPAERASDEGSLSANSIGRCESFRDDNYVPDRMDTVL